MSIAAHPSGHSITSEECSIGRGTRIARQLVGIQIGIRIARAINPLNGVDSRAIAMFYSIRATVIFLSANGHHGVLAALRRTFGLAPIGEATLPPDNPVQLIAPMQSVSEVAPRIALLTITVPLLSGMGPGLTERAASQMQTLVVGVPVTIGVGLVLAGGLDPNQRDQD